MSLELEQSTIEQSANATLTPVTDRVMEMAVEKIPKMTEVECIPLRSGLRMAGLGYAEVQTRYENYRVEDGAFQALHGIYIDKTKSHIPEAIQADLSDGDYEEILDEQAAQARGQAELNILLASDIPVLTMDMVNPTEETLQKEQVRILTLELEKRGKELAAKDEEIRALNRTIAEQKSRLGEDDESNETKEDLDYDYYEKESDDHQVKMGGTALHLTGVEVQN